MKRTLLVVAISCMTLASCKKNYSCTCTTSQAGQGGSVSSTFPIAGTKKEAKKICKADEAYNVLGMTTECELN